MGVVGLLAEHPVELTGGNVFLEPLEAIPQLIEFLRCHREQQRHSLTPMPFHHLDGVELEDFVQLNVGVFPKSIRALRDDEHLSLL